MQKIGNVFLVHNQETNSGMGALNSYIVTILPYFSYMVQFY